MKDKTSNNRIKKWKKLKSWIENKSGGTVATDKLHIMPRWRSLKEWIGRYSAQVSPRENISMDTEMEDVVDANECRNERIFKRKCEYNADPIWSKRMRLTKSILPAKRKRLRPYERKTRAKIEDNRLLTILPQLIYPQSYFSFHNIKSVGS